MFIEVAFHWREEVNVNLPYVEVSRKQRLNSL